MTETCENCGHSDGKHYEQDKMCLGTITCSCKKFKATAPGAVGKAKNHSHQKDLTKSSGEFIHTAPCGGGEGTSNLSEKGVGITGPAMGKTGAKIPIYYPEEDVKEAIRKLKEEIFHDGLFTDLEIVAINKIIDKIFGSLSK